MLQALACRSTLRAYYASGTITPFVIGTRGYAKPKGKGGKGGKPKAEIPKMDYMGPLDFSWWKKIDAEQDTIAKLADPNTTDDVQKEFAGKIQKGKYKMSRELFTKFIADNTSKHLRKPAIELDEDFELYYRADATYDIHAEVRMVGGKYGCAKLREEGYIPGVITGKGYPEFAIQISKKAISTFLDTDQEERLSDGKKFNLVIEGRRYLVTPRDSILDPVSLDPKFIQWFRLCDPLVKEKIRPVPRKHRIGGPTKRFPWIWHPHYAFEKKTKPWMTEERAAGRKARRDTHIHDYLGIPR